MLWVRFSRDGVEGFGTLADNVVAVHEGDMFAGAAPTGKTLGLDAVTLLAPVRPGKFIGLWNNFHAVATKQGNAIPTFPLYFLKATSSIIGPEAAFRRPRAYAGRVVYEGELGVVIGQTCTDVSEDEAVSRIFGYTCVNDITAADIFNAGPEFPSFPQWARAKGFDGFGPIGPGIATGIDPMTALVKVALDGRERQNYPLADMILPPARIVALLSQEMTLHPGDLIACGTSVNLLPMQPRMEVTVTIDGIGVLRNRFAAE